ncbi:NAD(P)H-dependent flavin oxidoreductase [Variovorax sp. DT-64]|uniref:NAD(P)H-dependent flavin oxidoreductase n=1 Tax=Variovorax sp. DT-64 TaxID=3396160 RepID=UPI003F1AFEAC
MGLPSRIRDRLRLPLIAAPMLRVSGPRLVTQACRQGVIGAFPTANAGEELESWLEEITSDLAQVSTAAPWCPNLIMSRSKTLDRDVEILARYGVEMVITSVGSPAPVIAPLHAAGCLVLADVATLRHAHRAVEAGADGLILLSAGAGGQTGWLNGLAFVRAVRSFFAGPIVLAGGVSDGQSLLAAQVLGCDLAYMGTKFIATDESLAAAEYKQMLLRSEADDVVLTRAFTGLQTNMLRPSIVRAGLDPDRLDETTSAERARAEFGAAGTGEKPTRWKDIWSAGHSVSGVRRLASVADTISEIEQGFRDAVQSFTRQFAPIEHGTGVCE